MSPSLIVFVLAGLLVVVLASTYVRRQAAAIRAADARALRERILRSTASDLGVQESAGEPFSIVMDVARRDGVATVMATATGDASICVSNGAGIVGGIAHESVRIAALAFVREAARHAGAFARAEEFALPAVGRVRFYARTSEGSQTSEVPEHELREGRHPLSPLYAAGQNVISALRQAAPQG